jgi:hypothetical protein
MKFRKKLVVIEATQWRKMGDHPAVVDAWKNADGIIIPSSSLRPASNVYSFYRTCAIETLEGWHQVSVGDWIITGVQGEHYPCKPDIFALTYEEVNDGVSLNSIHHPEGDGIEPEGLNLDSLETVEIEIPMNKRLKELAEQAGLEEHPVHGDWSSLNYPDVRGADLERFAQLVRDDEREAIAALVEADGRVHPKAPDAVWAKTVAKLIRARGKT